MNYSSSSDQSFSFTANRSGELFIDILECNRENSFTQAWLVEDTSGKHVAGHDLNSLDQLHAVFEATGGEKYTLTFDYQGYYNANLYQPREVLDLSGATLVKDTVEYREQTITYTYTPGESGHYCFIAQEINVNAKPSMRIFDHLGNSVDSSDGKMSNGDVFWCDLKKGEAYTIKVYFPNIEKGTSYPFQIAIVPQSEAADITGYDEVQDCLLVSSSSRMGWQYSSQYNKYQYTASKNGAVSFCFKNIQEGNKL